MKIEYNGVNTNKLHDELIAAGIIPVLVESLGETTWITYADDTDMDAVQRAFAAHDPAPTPIELTDVEKLKIRTAANEDALAGMMDLMMGGML